MNTMQAKVAIITGSSRGIGEAIARRLSAEGAYVSINSCLSVKAGRALADALPHALYCQADVSDSAQASQLVARTLARWGRLDILVNNVGFSQCIGSDDLAAMSTEVFQDFFRVNVLSAWLMSQASYPHLQSSESGVIVNISSVAGVQTCVSSIPYAIAKAALNHLTRLLAKSMAPQVRVNAIAPSYVKTARASMGGWDVLEKRFANQRLLKHLCKASDVAEAVLGVIRAEYMTGQVVTIDGGGSCR